PLVKTDWMPKKSNQSKNNSNKRNKMNHLCGKMLFLLIMNGWQSKDYTTQLLIQLMKRKCEVLYEKRCRLCYKQKGCNNRQLGLHPCITIQIIFMYMLQP